MASPTESPEDDPRDGAVVWLPEIWNDGRPREWLVPKSQTVCATTEGALHAVTRLTEFVEPTEHQQLVREHVHAKLKLPDDWSTVRTEMAGAIRVWAGALEQTFLIATDKGGGHIAEVWCASGHDGSRQVSRREAQQLFREHGLLLVIDLMHLRTVALMLHPDKKASFQGDLRKWTVRAQLRAQLGAPPPAEAPPPPPPPPTDNSIMDARVRAALESAKRALAAAE